MILRSFCPNEGDSVGLTAIHTVQDLTSRRKRSRDQNHVISNKDYNDGPVSMHRLHGSTLQEGSREDQKDTPTTINAPIDLRIKNRRGENYIIAIEDYNSKSRSIYTLQDLIERIRKYKIQKGLSINHNAQFSSADGSQTSTSRNSKKEGGNGPKEMPITPNDNDIGFKSVDNIQEFISSEKRNKVQEKSHVIITKNKDNRQELTNILHDSLSTKRHTVTNGNYNSEFRLTNTLEDSFIREKRSENSKKIQVITFDEWQKIRNEGDQVPTVNVKPKVLLVVSKDVETSSETFKEDESTTKSASSTPPEGESSSEEEKCAEAFCVEKDSGEKESNSTNNLQSKDESVTKLITNTESPAKNLENSKVAMENLAQWIQILRNLTPILPMIPSLINSFSHGENRPTSSAANTFHGSGGVYDPTMPSGEQIFNWKTANEKRLSPTSTVSPISPVVSKSIYGRFLSPASSSSPSYEAPMKNPKDSTDIENINLSALTVNELKTLESIHKKIFPVSHRPEQKQKIKKTSHGESKQRLQGRGRVKSLASSSTSSPSLPSSSTAAPFVVFEKPRQITDSSPGSNTDAKGFRYLTPEMIRELNMVASLPDLEPLTEGLDLSLLNKPGGFAVLKQQFLERLFQKLPLKTEDSDLLLTSK